VDSYGLPTAFVHLFCVELLPLWILIASWYQSYVTFLMNDLGSTCAPQQNTTTIAKVNLCFRSAALRYLAFGPLDATCQYRNVGYVLASSHGTKSFGNGVCNFIYKNHVHLPAFWAVPLLSGILAAYVYIQWLLLVKSKPDAVKFGSGAYLRWSWTLENDRMYKVIVILISLSPIGLALFQMFYTLTAYLRFSPQEAQLVSNNALSIIYNSGLTLFAIKKLAFPNTPCHTHWTTDFDDYSFQRGPLELFSESNDWFGMRLVDAMWKAALHNDNVDLLDDPKHTNHLLKVANLSMNEEQETPRSDHSWAEMMEFHW